jgi:hypothetical protein
MGDIEPGPAPVPGVLVAWSGTRPRSLLYPLEHPVVLGRGLLDTDTDDERLSRDHVRITPQLGAVSLGRNGTSVNGAELPRDVETQLTAGAVLRAGRTVAVLVADVRDYDLAEPAPRAHLLSGRRTAALHAGLDDAARAGAHVVLVGDPGSGRRYLAHTYAKLLAPLPAQVALDPFLDREGVDALLDALACSYDLRLVVTQNRVARPFKPLLDTFLHHHARRFDVPPLHQRADEVASMIHDITARSGVACTGSVLEYCLLHAGDNLSALLAGVAAMTPARGAAVAYGTDLERARQVGWVQFASLDQRR